MEVRLGFWRRHNDDDDEDIDRDLRGRLLRGQRTTMAKLDELQAAIDKLGSDLETFIATNAGGGTDQAAIDALTAKVSSIDGQIPAAAGGSASSTTATGDTGDTTSAVETTPAAGSSAAQDTAAAVDASAGANSVPNA